jgi:hypothetical protein
MSSNSALDWNAINATFIVYDEYTHCWYCNLCTTGAMPSWKVVKSHRNGGNHRHKFASFKNAQTNAHALSERVKYCVREIGELPTEKWRWHMNHLCYMFATHQASLCESTLLDTLAMYQAKEKLSLLDLAVWKHHCLPSFAEMTCSRTVSMQDIEDYGALDQRFAPRAFRTNVRVKGGALVIIEHVLPFLGRRF